MIVHDFSVCSVQRNISSMIRFPNVLNTLSPPKKNDSCCYVLLATLVEGLNNAICKTSATVITGTGFT